MGQVVYGEGIARYVESLSGQSSDAVFDAAGDLEALPVTALVIGFTHHWSSTLKSGISYATADLDNAESQCGERDQPHPGLPRQPDLHPVPSGRRRRRGALGPPRQQGRQLRRGLARPARRDLSVQLTARPGRESTRRLMSSDSLRATRPALAIAAALALAACTQPAPAPTPVPPPTPPQPKTTAVAAPTTPHWDYGTEHGPANWASLSPDFATCASGKSQSPIDIVKAKTEKVAELQGELHAGRAARRAPRARGGRRQQRPHRSGELHGRRLADPGRRVVQAAPVPLPQPEREHGRRQALPDGDAPRPQVRRGQAGRAGGLHRGGRRERGLRAGVVEPAEAEGHGVPPRARQGERGRPAAGRAVELPLRRIAHDAAVHARA